jgi:cysteinyl-tRNA synthetase
MEDDLNTPQALTDIHALTRAGVIAGFSRLGDSYLAPPQEIKSSSAKLRGCLRLLGVGRVCEPDWNRPSAALDDARRKEVESSISHRNKARAAKNWAESDRIRDELEVMGIVLKDNKDGTTTWEVK